MVAGAVTDVKPPGFADAPGDDLASYTSQRLRWTDCDGGYRCATFLTPLDWQDPGAQAITIAMKMRPASTGPYMGPLFVNPGGPGGSAQDYVVGFPTSGLEGFDIIGLDSRGSGESTPVVCGTGAQTDAYLNTDFTPDDQSERDALIAAQQAFNEECRQASGALLDHISTIEAIYDYDLARQLIGAEKLSFFGTSYGTFLGAVYAELYPTRMPASLRVLVRLERLRTGERRAGGRGHNRGLHQRFGRRAAARRRKPDADPVAGGFRAAAVLLLRLGRLSGTQFTPAVHHDQR